MATKKKASGPRRASAKSARTAEMARVSASNAAAMREQVFALTTLIDQPFDLYRHLPFRLATLTNLLALSRDAAIRQVSPLGLRELRVLLNIGSYMPIRISDVAYQTRLDTFTVSRAAKTLLKRRLIELRADPSDRRAQFARLTPAGVKQYREIIEVLEARGDAVTDVLTPQELESLYGMLTRLEERVESLLADHALESLERGERVAADQRELIRWRKRATAHRRLPRDEDAAS